MKTCGLTGGAGMGKSTAAGFLLERGTCVIDTDVLARQLVQPGQESLLEIQKTFGDQVVDAFGNLRRMELARLVFSDAAARKKLEAILHPRIRMLWRQRLEVCRSERKPITVIVIPLLFEIAAESEFDLTICVACSAESQYNRLRKRGWDENQIQQRIAAQWPIEKKMLKADYVIWNEGSMNVTAEQLRRVID